MDWVYLKSGLKPVAQTKFLKFVSQCYFRISFDYYYYLLNKVFHISVSRWVFTGAEWQQVSSSLQDSSQDSGCCQQCCRLESLYLSANFQVLQAFNNPLVIVPKAQITIGTIVTIMFHSFFNSLARSRYLSFFSHSFGFILWFAGTAKSTILQMLFYLFIN